MTERLYYTDSYLADFEAQVVEAQPAAPHYRLYLDRTAFYPSSGGQPCDSGRIAGQPVIEVVDEGERIAHVLQAELRPGPVSCEIDFSRRFDHMQQHSGQHLLSAVFVEMFGYSTVSFHLGSETSTIDVAAPELTPQQIEAVESRANALVFDNRVIAACFYSPEEAAPIGLRKPTEREGPVRVVEIEGYDRSACGGTHVRFTGEIGPVLIRRLDRIRQTARVEFICGRRAVGRARADYNALAQVAQHLSAPLDQAPSLVAAQMETARTVEKARQKLENELASFKGKDLYLSTPLDARGRRVYQTTQSTGPLEPWRLLAQSFASAGSGGVFLLTLEQPPTLLLAVSADLNIHAGNVVKSVVEPLGGRGGGNPRLAQGSLPDAARAADALHRVLALIG